MAAETSKQHTYRKASTSDQPTNPTLTLPYLLLLLYHSN